MLVIYSGEVSQLDQVLRDKLGEDHVFTVIPCSSNSIGDAKYMAGYFRDVGLRARVLSARYYRDVSRLKQAIMSSDAVFLMGGNTYEFLAYAYAVGLFPLLTEFEAKGGVIVAESAGSIILSPSIATAAIPTGNPDINEVGINHYCGMSRICFHVSPHFDPQSPRAEQDLAELQELSNHSKLPVIVLRDGEGFVMEEYEIDYSVGEPLILTPQPSLNLKLTMPSWVVELEPSL